MVFLDEQSMPTLACNWLAKAKRKGEPLRGRPSGIAAIFVL
jgi:hypothetical protein